MLVLDFLLRNIYTRSPNSWWHRFVSALPGIYSCTFLLLGLAEPTPTSRARPDKQIFSQLLNTFRTFYENWWFNAVVRRTSKSAKMQLLASSRLSCLSAPMQQLGSHWTDLN